MKETRKEDGDKVIITTTYDNSFLLESNKRERNAANEHGRYKQNTAGLIKVGSLHEGDIVRLMNMGYNLYSADKEERKRALLYIQENEPYLLTMPGKPIARKKQVWV